MKKLLNKYSSEITQPKAQGASQAMLYATGLTEQDMAKPQVGIASMWFEGNPCNMHLLKLGEKVKEGVEAAGLVGLRFNTIGVSDGISMGTEGMSYSLQSRDLIADSIETVMAAQWYDANVSIPGCDKNMPGCIIAMGRLNRPSLMVYGGTIRAGHHQQQKLDIVSAFQSYGQFISHAIDDNERQAIVRHACPGAGACGGMYTANTMASAIEALGMSLPYSSSTPAEDPAKTQECVVAGAVIRNLLELDLKPRDIMTREAFENAMVIVSVLGGSTKPTSKEEATRPEFKTCKYTTEAIVSEGIDKGEIRKVCTEPTCPVHHPKARSQKVADDPKAKAQEERQRREVAIANTTGIRTLAAIAEAVPVRLMKRDLLFVAERLASLLDENRLSIVARRYGIKKAKDSDSLGKPFAAYLRRAEESVLGSVLVEATILYMSTRHNPAQVLHEAATVYKVDTDAIALKVKQEFAAKEKMQTGKKTVAKTPPKAVKKAKAA